MVQEFLKGVEAMPALKLCRACGGPDLHSGNYTVIIPRCKFEVVAFH